YFEEELTEKPHSHTQSIFSMKIDDTYMFKNPNSLCKLYFHVPLFRMVVKEITEEQLPYLYSIINIYLAIAHPTRTIDIGPTNRSKIQLFQRDNKNASASPSKDKDSPSPAPLPIYRTIRNT